jgi:hypothetical protein
MTVNLNDFKREIECVYKDERYSVRDNGAILRHAREGKRLRKYDNQWTFGKPNNYGYMLIVSEVVHRIVATAFHGDPPSEHNIVDHIDTNRQNNRPENLRWLTKLENALNNPITRKKIEFLCGSIENFLKDPSVLRNHVNKDPNFGWMRKVTPEEARISLKRMSIWSKSERGNSSSKKGELGEWIFEDNRSQSSYQENSEYKPEQNELVNSKTPGVVQKDWKIPSEFPLCPPESKKTSLEQNLQHLKTGEVFARNKYGESIVHSAELSENSEALLVLCNNLGGVKEWTLVRISIEDQQFVHESIQTFFSLEGAQKQFTLDRGLKWEGGDSIDDYS